MQDEARNEGYSFLEPLVDEWVSGQNRFDGPGEILCGHFEEGLLIAVGGLNCDPYLRDARVGRVRRLYVKAAWRNLGVGGALLDELLRVARNHFDCVRLRAGSERAARLYQRRGFAACDSDSATHVLTFR